PSLELPGSSSVASVLSRERSERVVKFLKPLRATATSHVSMENRLMGNRMRERACALARLMLFLNHLNSGTGTGTLTGTKARLCKKSIVCPSIQEVILA
ncbi:MAG: hypothetical protein WA347_08440, partial [Rhabdochlamydiaceae bacterium]